MTAIFVLESEIAPRDCVKKCDLTLTVMRQVLRLSSVLQKQVNPYLVTRESAEPKPCLVTRLVVRGLV